jgi:hypothetical protein
MQMISVLCPTLLRKLSKIQIFSIAAWLILDSHFNYWNVTCFQGFMTMFLQPARNYYNWTEHAGNPDVNGTD